MSFKLTLGKPEPTPAMQSGSERHKVLRVRGTPKQYRCPYLPLAACRQACSLFLHQL